MHFQNSANKKTPTTRMIIFLYLVVVEIAAVVGSSNRAAPVLARKPHLAGNNRAAAVLACKSRY